MSDTKILDFQLRFETVLNNSATNLIDNFHFVTLASNKKPWFDTGITVTLGDCFTSFATGQTQFKDLPLRFDANFQIWFRIGLDGEIFRGTRDSHSFTAEKSGKLYLASYFPGEWATKTGELSTPDEVYDWVTGNFEILLVKWHGASINGLKQLVKYGDVENLIMNEIDRLESPVIKPEGWDYLWFLGDAEIYKSIQFPEKPTAICCHTHKDGGLLQKSVSLAFKPDTRLRWSWKMDLLPSAVREDTLPTHDYLSIAVEFDNGQDITYYWSAELEPETVYRCPIPTWHDRETHVVIRSGSQDLGKWINEERDVYADYQNAIGGVLPKNIVKVWFIAVSLFQRQEGLCEYADVNFICDDEIITVL